MRRLFISIFTLGVLLGMLTGCQNFFCHTAGVCDCDYDDDPCTHRAPWVRGYGVAGTGSPSCASGSCGAPAVGPDGVAGVRKDISAQPVSRSK